MKNNIPAFPDATTRWDKQFEENEIERQEGMTLLDYVATHVGAQLCHIENYQVNNGHPQPQEIARVSYEMAAAFIEERKKYINL